jgi:copper(I)-binding protein
MKLKTLFATFSLALAFGAGAHEFKLGDIRIGHPYARATVAGQPGGAFLKLDNAGADDKLLSARTELASRAELHSMAMEGDVMRMRQVDSITLPSGKTVELKPGGLHLMLFGPKAPSRAATSFR